MRLQHSHLPWCGAKHSRASSEPEGRVRTACMRPPHSGHANSLPADAIPGFAAGDAINDQRSMTRWDRRIDRGEQSGSKSKPSLQRQAMNGCSQSTRRAPKWQRRTPGLSARATPKENHCAVLQPLGWRTVFCTANRYPNFSNRLRASCSHSSTRRAARLYS
jgi:hypothetical protein